MAERWAIITGAAGGIGIAVCRQLHSQGFCLLMLDLQEGPLMKFPPRAGLTGLQVGADSTANTGVRVDYASLGGPVYELDPNVLLVPTQNFQISLNWASAVDIGANCTIVCNLGGVLYRNSQ